MKKAYFLVCLSLFVTAVFFNFSSPRLAMAAPVACCYGDSCAIANGASQCRNTGGEPANSDSCEPNPCHGAQPSDSLEPGPNDNTQVQTVTAEDLGVDEPLLLPTSPFYFFKNFTRSVQKFFTFGQVKKIALEAKFADEKIVEAKKVADRSPENADALKKAIENYQNSQEDLKERLGALKETSQNPNVDALIQKLADRVVKHEQIFDELVTKAEDNTEIKETIESAKDALENSMVEAAKKDTIEKLAKKFGTASGENSPNETAKAQSREITDRLLQKAMTASNGDATEDILKNCEDEKNKIIDIQNLYKNKSIAEKDFLAQTEIAQKNLVFCFQQAPKQEQPAKPIPTSGLKKDEVYVYRGIPCTKIIIEYDKLKKELDQMFADGIISDTLYKQLKAELEKRYKDCSDEFDALWRIYDDSFETSAADAKTREEARAAALKKCEEFAQLMKKYDQDKISPFSPAYKDLQDKYDALNCDKVLSAPSRPSSPNSPGSSSLPENAEGGLPSRNIEPLAGDMFKIISVEGYSARPSAGEVWPLMIKVVEPDYTTASPPKGFNVQVYIIVPKVKTIFGGNAKFNGSTWDILASAPKESGSYRLSVLAYCGVDNSLCERVYGKARQVEWVYDFTVGKTVIETKEPTTSTNHCVGLNNILRDLKEQYSAGKITQDELDSKAKIYQEEESVACAAPQPVLPRPTPVSAECEELGNTLNNLKAQYIAGQITQDEFNDKTKPLQDTYASSCISPPPPPPTPTLQSAECDKLNSILKDLKTQYLEGKITLDELNTQAKPYQDQEASLCPVSTGETG